VGEVETPVAKESQPETSSSNVQEEAPPGASSPAPMEVPPADEVQADSVEPASSDTASPEPVKEEERAKEDEPVAGGAVPSESTSIETKAPPAEHVSAETTPVDARDITLSQSTVDLLRFVRFTDFVPCDYNKDSVVDIIALNSRLSTGYSFCGIGNGLFTEGPSFDLPFRPAAAVPLGDSGDAINGLFLVSSVGTVSLFYPLLEDDPTVVSKASAFSAFRVDTADGPIFAVHGEDGTSVRIYLLISGGLQDKGEYPALRTNDITDWYNQVTMWDSLDAQLPFPLPPSGMEKTVRIADFNGDAIPDLIYYDSGKMVYLLSRDGEALAEEQMASCHAKPVALRVADVDGNGFPDVLALIGTSGTLEMYLVTPE